MTSNFKVIQDFLIAVSDPINRSGTVHVYQLSKASLYAAASLDYQPVNIISQLKEWCRDGINDNITDMIRKSGKSYGKAHLVLKDHQYYVESQNREFINLFVKNVVRKQDLNLNYGNGSLLWRIDSDHVEGKSI